MFSHVGEHPFPEDVVCACLTSLAGFLQPGENIGIEAQRNNFLAARCLELPACMTKYFSLVEGRWPTSTMVSHLTM